jgi:hypothetical protein
MDLKLKPCRSCGRPRVLNPGDYCIKCAVIWHSETALDNYFIVEPGTFDDTAQVSGLDPYWLAGQMVEAETTDCQFVVFFTRNRWESIRVSNAYHIPTVMRKVFERLRD